MCGYCEKGYIGNTQHIVAKDNVPEHTMAEIYVFVWVSEIDITFKTTNGIFMFLIASGEDLFWLY